jgi:GT2 family glycosyltransferase
MGSAMRIGLAIASVGRPEILRQMLLRLRRQTRAPDRILVVAAAPADLPDGGVVAPVEAMFGPRGSSAQRNCALEILSPDCDIVVFIDDDYTPTRDFVAGVARLFSQHADVVAASGHLIADGFRSPGLSFEEADALIDAYERQPHAEAELVDDTGTYGCNMAMRVAAAPLARFDENLPLYGWLEDTDFSWHFAQAGRVVRCNHFAGVHLGAKSGRTSGVRFGYSQIANPIYLVAKGTMDARRAYSMAAKQVVANLIKVARPEPWIDRAGRLKGNWLAFMDLMRDDIHPKRILDL